VQTDNPKKGKGLTQKIVMRIIANSSLLNLLYQLQLT